jgi:ubiquinone/menaquinone biosynthesis C-methylase UbiE
MLARAQRALGVSSQEERVTLHLGDAERLPLPTSSLDVALINGIFNLNPARAEIFPEVLRVLRPGGRVFAAELVLATALEIEMTAANWFG